MADRGIKALLTAVLAFGAVLAIYGLFGPAGILVVLLVVGGGAYAFLAIGRWARSNPVVSRIRRRRRLRPRGPRPRR